MAVRNLSPAMDNALGECFQAVVEPDLWLAAMENLSQALGHVGCSFYPRDARSRLSLPASPAYRDMLTDFVAQGWAEHDPRAKRGWSLVDSGATIVTESDISTPAERARSPFYREFLRPRDMTEFIGIGFKVDDQHWSLSGARSSRRGPANAREIALMRALQPHLARLVRFSERMSRKTNASALSALDAAGQAAMLVGWRGRVVAVNERARALIGDRIDIRMDRLVVHDPLAHTEMQRLIDAVTSRDTPWSEKSTVIIRRQSGLPIIAEAIPARGALADTLGLSGALLLFTDLEKQPARDGTLLCPAFGLTQRESAVALRLSNGESTEEIADGLAILPSSVRQIVKSVLGKVGVSSRAELVALLGRLPEQRA